MPCIPVLPDPNQVKYKKLKWRKNIYVTYINLVRSHVWFRIVNFMSMLFLLAWIIEVVFITTQ